MNNELLKREIELKVGLNHKVNEKLKLDFYEYACSHQTIGNKWTHAIGIPTIIVGSLGLLSLIKLGSFLNAGLITWALINFWLLTLDPKLTIPFAISSFIALLIGEQLNYSSQILLLILGWSFQFIGHYIYEKRKPSFLTSIRHMVIGPVWLLSRLLKL